MEILAIGEPPRSVAMIPFIAWNALENHVSPTSAERKTVLSQNNAARMAVPTGHFLHRAGKRVLRFIDVGAGPPNDAVTSIAWPTTAHPSAADVAVAQACQRR